MVFNASNTDLDITVKEIVDNEMGILLLKEDEPSLYDILTKRVTFTNRMGMYGNGSHITYHLYPLFYKRENMDITPYLIKSRESAVHNVFQRWSELGYNKRKAKSPYASKAFNLYLEKIGFNESDYMLLLVDKS